MSQIPALLKKKSNDIKFCDVETQNFNECPEASSMFRQLIRNHINGKLTSSVPLNSKERTQEYVKNKPSHIRKQQFKNYLDF